MTFVKGIKKMKTINYLFIQAILPLLKGLKLKEGR